MSRALLVLLAGALLALPVRPAQADDPEELVHVPIEEMDVLLKSGKRGIVLRYDEYKALVDAARARRDALLAEPPIDGALVSADGMLYADAGDAARFELTYDVRVLAEGPRSVPFPVGGFGIERLTFSGGEGLFEERRGRPRLFFQSPGQRQVRVQASGQYSKKGESRLLDLRLPPAAAMGVTIRFPAGFDAIVVGEGPSVRVRAKSREHTLRVRPSRTGRLRLAMAPAAKGTDGPPILDSQVHGVHSVADGVISSDIAVHTDVLRTAVTTLRLRVPADLAVLDLGGDGVTGFRRSTDRVRIDVDFDKPRLGPIGLKLRAESAYVPGPDVAPPSVRVEDAVRHREHVGLRFGSDVKLRGVTPTGGRRVPAGKGQGGAFVYALAGTDAGVSFALEPGLTRTEAVSTYYLNLGETGKTLLATTTYRVVEGTVFSLAPVFPAGYELRNLTIGGKAAGFTRDLRPDGTLEIRLARGVPRGSEIALAATLEEANAEWLPDGPGVVVPLRVPSSGADRQEGLVAVGADASYRVLETARADLVPVGAGELTARGIAAAGLAYGYRLDGDAPALTLGVKRREPLVAADIVTAVAPTPRRLEISAMVVHRIDRAPIRRLLVDVPAWAGDEVRFAGTAIRAWNRLSGDDAPADVPAGFSRWRVDLDRRVIGRHVMLVGYHRDEAEQDWAVESGTALCARVPVEQSERMLVVRRAQGLEVSTALPDTPDVRTLDISELPPEAAVDPLAVLEIVRLSNGANGIGLSVKKHDGAAVLDAIATQVALATAVAGEGVLRTRCEVMLFNVDRQFLGVTLPPNSELIGAVVGGKPVKPLAKEDGTVLLPVPTAHAGGRVVAAFTYETQLGEELSGEVEIEGPAFENLEVLHTTHRVAFEPDLRIDAVEGSFTGRDLEVTSARKPLIAGIALGGADEKGYLSAPRRAGEAMAIDIDDHVETDNDLPFEESFGETESADEAPFDGPTTGDVPRTRHSRAAGRGAPAAAEKARNPRIPGAKPAKPTPGRAAADAGAVPPPAPMQPGMPAPDPSPDEDEEDVGHEGAGSPFVRQKTRDLREAARRKGLLSLDVPVLLAPNEVMAHRLGSGGRMTIKVSNPDTEPRVWGGLLLLFTVGGLIASRFGRLLRWGSIGALALLALLVHLLLGDAAATLAAALFDAATILVGLHALHTIGRWMVGAPRAAATAALLLLAVVCATPAAADEPRPKTPKVKKPGTIYVPYDPADKADIEKHDKVFLPLDTYLKLYKAAHPESDPELVALGRYVTLLDAKYDLEIASGSDAEGTITYAFAKRGDGLELVGLPLGGMAITQATLDGRAVRLLLDRGIYRIPLEGAGKHELKLSVHVPVVRQGDRRRLGFQGPAFAGAHLTVRAEGFAGRMHVNGAGRVKQGEKSGDAWTGEAWLGRTHKVAVALVDPAPDTLPTEIVTRATASTLFSLREDGTEIGSMIRAHVLQGRAPFLDIDLPEGSVLLEAKGPKVVRWEPMTGSRVRVVFQSPVTGEIPLSVRAFQASDTLARDERLVAPQLVGATGESGRYVVNVDPAARVDVVTAQGLYRDARPRTRGVAGPDGRGRVLGAWTYASRPASLAVRVTRAAPRIEVSSVLAVVFGDDRVRSRLEALVDVDPGRTPVGHLVFDLPGADTVRDVASPGLADWWTVGEGSERALHVRYVRMRTGRIALRVQLERRLGGMTDGITVPRWKLRGASRDQGRLVLYSLPDVEPSAGALPGLQPVALERARPPASFVPNARPVHAFAWERPLDDSLVVVLREPDLEMRAMTIAQIAPSDEEHRIETLVLFDVRRGATDRVRVFVPDGGRSSTNVIRAREVREIREQQVTRKGADGADVLGTLYDLTLQSARGGLIEVALSQAWLSGRLVRLPQPEDVADRRWYTLVRTFMDGSVDVAPEAGRVEKSVWDDLPFVPTGLDPSHVVAMHDAREPYVLRVQATRHGIEEQSAAVVLAAQIDAVLGRDGHARMRATYRVFNRSRQFLRLKLPDGALLYGASSAGRAVKPLAGAGGTVLLPVPKVSVGGAGYNVTVAYRARVGEDLDEGKALEIAFPEVPGVEVDRTVVRLFVPEGYRYAMDTDMSEVEHGAVAAELAEAAIREARTLLKITESGNLEQRVVSAHNARKLIAEARQLAESRSATKARPELREELRQVEGICNLACTKADADWKAAQGQVMSVNPSQLEIAGNAAQLIQLDEVTSGSEKKELGESNRAGWRFNNDAPQSGQGGRKANQQLKKQIQGQLRGRAASEVQKRRASKAASQEQQDQSKQRQQEAELRREIEQTINERAAAHQAARQQAKEVTRGYDTKNFAELNKRLAQSWSDNGQLGAAPGLTESDLTSGLTDFIPPHVRLVTPDEVDSESPLFGGEAEASLDHLMNEAYLTFQRQRRTTRADQLIGYTDMYNSNFAWKGRGGRAQGIGPRGLGTGVTRDDVFFGSPANPQSGGFGVAGGGDAGGAALNPTHGAYFDEGDGDFRARTENSYDRPLASVKGKRGLMGVDVPLPAVGKVYYFKSLRAGSSIEIEADKDEVSLGGRIAMLLLIVAALGALTVGLARRAKRAAG